MTLPIAGKTKFPDPVYGTTPPVPALLTAVFVEAPLTLEMTVVATATMETIVELLETKVDAIMVDVAKVESCGI